MENKGINWGQKLSSRKLWAMIVGVVVGLAAAFGINENDYVQVAGIVTSAASIVSYIFGESTVDAVREQTTGTPETQPEEPETETESE